MKRTGTHRHAQARACACAGDKHTTAANTQTQTHRRTHIRLPDATSNSSCGRKPSGWSTADSMPASAACPSNVLSSSRGSAHSPTVAPHDNAPNVTAMRETPCAKPQGAPHTRAPTRALQPCGTPLQRTCVAGPPLSSTHEARYIVPAAVASSPGACAAARPSLEILMRGPAAPNTAAESPVAPIVDAVEPIAQRRSPRRAGVRMQVGPSDGGTHRSRRCAHCPHSTVGLPRCCDSKMHSGIPP